MNTQFNCKILNVPTYTIYNYSSFIVHTLNYLHIHLCNPVFLQNPHNNSLGNLLYAFSRSMKTITKFLLFSLYFSINCLTQDIISIVDFPGIHTNWFFNSSQFLPSTFSPLLSPICSMNIVHCMTHQPYTFIILTLLYISLFSWTMTLNNYIKLYNIRHFPLFHYPIKKFYYLTWKIC